MFLEESLDLIVRKVSQFPFLQHWAEGDDFEPVILEGQAQDGIGIDLQTAPKLDG